MNGELLPEGDNFVHYCSPTRVNDDTGLPMAAAFQLRRDKDETSLSANWIEYFKGSGRDAAVGKIQEALSKKIKVSEKGRLAILNVGAAIQVAIEATSCALSVVHLPEEEDPSYSRVYGYPDDPELELRLATALKNLLTPENSIKPFS